MIFAWLTAQWDALAAAHRQQRLHHAVLISGPPGIGKESLATTLAQSLLCQATDAAGFACGRCPACRLFQAGTHPDYLVVRPEETGKSIKIEQVRELGTSLTMTSHAGGRKVALIAPADALNLNAANSLLKTLEEPTDNTHILLVTAAPGRLPITVRSRCQSVKCALPSRPVALEWLAGQLDAEADGALLLDIANGAPLAARDLATAGTIEEWRRLEQELAALAEGRMDPIALASQWQQRDGLRCLQWTRIQLEAALRLHQGGRVRDGFMQPSWLGNRKGIDARRLFRLLDQNAFAVNQWSSGLNRSLLLEDLLLAWVEVLGSARVGRTGSNPVRGTK